MIKTAPLWLTAALSAGVLIWAAIWGRGPDFHHPPVTLASVMEQINANTPHLLDKTARLERADTGPPGTVTFHVTTLSPDDASVRKERARVYLCGQFSFFARQGLTVIYAFQTSDGREDGQIKVMPEDCAP